MPSSKSSKKFLDLPAEIRLNIYTQLFTKTLLLVDQAPCNCIAETRPDHHICDFNTLPGILVVCRKVRDEALPIFAQNLTPVIQRTGLIRPYSERIPQHYLRNAHQIIVQDSTAAIDNLKHVPWLRKLSITMCEHSEGEIVLHGGKFHCQYSSPASIVARIESQFEWRDDLGWDIEVLGPPPFQVIVHFCETIYLRKSIPNDFSIAKVWPVGLLPYLPRY